MTQFKDVFWGPNGFEELKKYMRFGNEFCRELSSILVERSEAEMQYSKSLHKVGQRLQKLSKDFIGGLANGWFQVSLQFDTQAELHKHFSNALHDELIKPLKSLIENQTKSRKPVRLADCLCNLHLSTYNSHSPLKIETNVEKAIRVLSEKRSKDYKYRLRCYKTVKDIENSMYSLDEAQKGIHGKPPKQKDIQKIQDNLKSLQTLLDKSETKFHKACGNVEVSRQDWQSAMIKGCEQLQLLDEQRITQLSILLKRYTHQIGESSKKVAKMHESLQKIDINVNGDIVIAAKKYGNGANVHEIYLFDIYSENTKNMMNRDRRVANLNKWSLLLNTDIQSQIKCTEGLDKVRNFQKENPKFANNEDDVNQKLQSIELLQTLYEASLFKINTAVAELYGRDKPQYKFEAGIHLTYDKFGVPISILRLNNGEPVANGCNPSAPPAHLQLIPTSSSSTPSTSSKQNNSISLYSLNNLENSNIYSSNGHSLNTKHIIQMPQPEVNAKQQNKQTKLLSPHKDPQPPSYKDVISFPFSSNKRPAPALSVDSDEDEWNDSEFVSKCVVQFDYKSDRDDELTLKLGDTINVVEKRADGWWRGDLNGVIGLFPSTYVKEVSDE